MLAQTANSEAAPRLDPVSRQQSLARESGNQPGGIWSHSSTWALLLLLLYFALDGVSPFVNEPTAARAVATSSAGGVFTDRLAKLLMFAACMILAMQRHQAVRRLSMQMKLVTSFPILALLLSPLSQLPTRTISSGALLLSGVLLLYY